MFLQNALCFGTREAVGNLVVVCPNIARMQPEPSDSFQGCEQLQQEPCRRGPSLSFLKPGDNVLVVPRVNHNLSPPSSPAGAGE